MTTINGRRRKELQELMYTTYPKLQGRLTPVPEIVTYTRLRELATCGWSALEDYWEAEYQEMITPEPSFSAVCGEVSDHLYRIAELLDEWKGIKRKEKYEHERPTVTEANSTTWTSPARSSDDELDDRTGDIVAMEVQSLEKPGHVRHCVFENDNQCPEEEV